MALVIENYRYSYRVSDSGLSCQEENKERKKKGKPEINCYVDLVPLRKEEDADKNDVITNSLRKLGFEVLTLKNSTKDSMEVAVTKFKERLQDGGIPSTNTIGLVYFYRHSLEKQGENYLISADNEPSYQVKIPASEWFNMLSGGKPEESPDGKELQLAEGSANIFILEVCRSKGDEQKENTVNQRSTPRLPPRILVAFATEPGRIAIADGRYANTLWQYLSEPNLSIRDIFEKVNNDIREMEASESEKHRPTFIHGDDPEALFRKPYFTGKGFEGAYRKVVRQPILSGKRNVG